MTDQIYKRVVVQLESEIAEFIAILVREQVKSYLEIGSKWGGSLYRIATSLPRGSRIVSIDMPNWMGGSVGSAVSLAACVEELNAIGYDAHLLLGDSHSPDIVERTKALGPFDALFIDGDHSLAGATNDWETYGPLARIVAFHDIQNRGERKQIMVRPLWKKLRADYRHQEINESKKFCGIGVLWR